MDIVNDVRVSVWKQQSPAFFEGPARFAVGNAVFLVDNDITML